MAKQTFTTGQVLTAAQMTSLQQTAMLGGSSTAKTTSYVLLAADAGTAVTMNSASATTITANTSLFAAGDIVTIVNLGAGVCTITAGTATISTVGSLALSQNAGGVLYFTSASAAIFLPFDTGIVPSFVAGKNKLINGDFYINQRAFTSSTSSSSYNFDRWQQFFSGGSQTITPQTFTLGTAPVSGYEGKTFCRIVTATQSAAGDYSSQVQKIESVRTFAGQTITVSFWAKASTGTPNIGLSGLQNFGTGGSPSSSVIVTGSVSAITTSWARYSFTLSVPSIAGKTIGSNNDDHFRVDLWTSAGATLSGLGYPAVGVQNATIDVWGFQAEAGASATPFTTSTNSFQGELAACYRYYYVQTPDPASSNYAALATATGYGTTLAISHHPFPTTMRTNPTVTVSAANTFYWYMGNTNITPSAVAINTATSQFGSVTWTLTGGTNGLGGYITPINNKTSTIAWSAEL